MYIHTYIYVYTHMYMYICRRVCECERFARLEWEAATARLEWEAATLVPRKGCGMGSLQYNI